MGIDTSTTENLPPFELQPDKIINIKQDAQKLNR